MKPPKETVEQTLAKSQAMLDQTKAQGTKSFKGSSFDVAPVATPIAPVPTPTASTISATSLAPATPMKLAEPTPATQAQGMMAEFTDAVDTYTQNLADQAKALEAPKTNALNDYINQLTTAKGVTGLSNDAYAVKGGVNDITPELNDINDKIRREQLSTRRRTEAIAGQGQSKAQSAAQIANIERESFSKQADLAIIQQAVQGRYDSAKEIADRAVSAQLEKQTNDLAILKFNYDQNKSAFDKSEQRAFESAQADRERKLDEERQNLTDIKQFALSALQAGASTSEVQRAMQSKTLDEAINLVGGYLKPKPAGTGKRDTQVVGNQLIDMQTGEVISSIDTGVGTVNGKPQTEGQAKVNGYADRLLQSNRVLSQLDSNFTGKFALGGNLPNMLQSADRQAYEQGKRNFVTAVLRSESGASIAPSEFATAEKQYFAQPGDDDATLLQKQAARNTVINNFYREANSTRPVSAGDVIESNGKRYKVDIDGVTLIEV